MGAVRTDAAQPATRENGDSARLQTRPSDPISRTTTASSRPVATQRSAYTAPSPSFRSGAVVATVIGAASVSRLAPRGKEVSEAGMAGGQDFSAARGVGGLQGRAVNALVGQPGLQRGLPLGFGPLPRQNVFTRTVNPISGPTGAQAILAAAGFGAALRR